MTEPSQVGSARRAVSRLSAEIGLPEQERGALALIVTELGNNLVKYAKDGQIVMRAITESPQGGIEILSLDSGPGLSDTAKYLVDGYSSGGTCGNGLGAVRRMSQDFEIWSAAGVGTAIMARVHPPDALTTGIAPESPIVGAVCVPLAGEDRCGDAWSIRQDPNRTIVVVIDGLGHGAIAATAADEAIRVFENSATQNALEVVGQAHNALRATRGAVMAAAEVEYANSSVSFVGVGNIAGCLIGDDRVQHMVSVNGTAGLVAKPKAFSYAWKPGCLLTMNSDGVQNQWRWERFPGLLSRHPSIIAGVLFQQYARGRDDATVLAVRWSA